MTPFPALIALHLALWSVWLEAFGLDPVPVLRSAADMLEETK